MLNDITSVTSFKRWLKYKPDFRQDVSVAMDEDGLEHVGQHVLDLVSVLLQLFAPRKIILVLYQPHIGKLVLK